MQTSPLPTKDDSKLHGASPRSETGGGEGEDSGSHGSGIKLGLFGSGEDDDFEEDDDLEKEY